MKLLGAMRIAPHVKADFWKSIMFPGKLNVTIWINWHSEVRDNSYVIGTDMKGFCRFYRRYNRKLR
jgi:hypothetical protein